LSTSTEVSELRQPKGRQSAGGWFCVSFRQPGKSFARRADGDRGVLKELSWQCQQA
jgi:hypothetical protein